MVALGPIFAAAKQPYNAPVRPRYRTELANPNGGPRHGGFLTEYSQYVTWEPASYPGPTLVGKTVEDLSLQLP